MGIQNYKPVQLRVVETPIRYVPGVHLYQSPVFRRYQANRYLNPLGRTPDGVEAYHILSLCSAELHQISQQNRDAEYQRVHPYQAVFDKYTKPWVEYFFGSTPEERRALLVKRVIGGALSVFFYQCLSS